MKKQDKIDQEIRKTLDCFEQKEDLPVNPYFYTRLRQQLINKRSGSHFFNVLRPALVSLLVIVNIGTVLWYMDTRQDSRAASQIQLVDVLARDLNIEHKDNTLFD